MSFKVIIEVEDKNLGPFLAKLPKCDFDLKHVASVAPESVQNEKSKARKKSGPHAMSDTAMKMTGKVPNSTLLRRGLDLFEQMEVEHGIGSVSVEMLRNQVNANELADGVKFQRRLINEDYLEYIR